MRNLHKYGIGISIFFVISTLLALPNAISQDVQIISGSKSFTLSVFPYHPISCTLNERLTTIDSANNYNLVSENQVPVNPLITFSLISQSSGKPITNIQEDPMLACNFNTLSGGTVKITGKMEVIVQSRTDSTTKTISDQTINISQTLTNGLSRTLFSTLIDPSSISNGLANGKQAIITVYVKPVLNFIVINPNIYTSPPVVSWSGNDATTFQFTNSVASQASSNTNVLPLGCTGSICTSIPMNAGIHYILSYDSGNPQEADSSSTPIVPIKFSLFKQDQSSTSVSHLTDISFTVFSKPSNAYYNQVSVSNTNLKVTAHVQMGDNQPFNYVLPPSDIRYINDVQNGLAKIDFPVIDLDNAIVQNIQSVGSITPKNAQQTAVTLQVEGTFNVNYQGKIGVGTISGLSMYFPILYGTSDNINTQNICAKPDTQSGINPNGLSPSSGQSLNCVDYCSVYPQDLSCSQSSNLSTNTPSISTSSNTPNPLTSFQQTTTDNSQFLSGLQQQVTNLQNQLANKNSNQVLSSPNNSPIVNNGISGFCTNTSDVNACIMQLLLTQSGTSSVPMLLIYGIIFLIGIIIVIAVARRK